MKSPKVYLTDTGIVHSLLGVGPLDELPVHPKCGASWEGLMLHEVIQCSGA